MKHGSLLSHIFNNVLSGLYHARYQSYVTNNDKSAGVLSFPLKLTPKYKFKVKRVNISLRKGAKLSPVH